MAYKNKKNFAISELASSMNDSQLSATVKAGEGVKFPATNFWFIVDVEIMLCSSRTDDVLTITRGDQSTTPAAHNTAARCYNSPTIACVEDLEAAFPAGATNENVVVFDGATGEKIKDSGASKANLDDAITKKHSNSLDHTQGTDQKLDDGGVNEVTVANAKDAVDKKHTSGSEALGGDGSGTVSNATIDKIKGKEIDETDQGDDKILVYKTAGTKYVFEAKPGGVSYAQYVTVAKSGGDYTTISAALTAITDAATDKRYCILVYPGTYDETVTCKQWVDIVGLSRHVCRIIKSNANTMAACDNCTIMNLSIINSYNSDSGAVISRGGSSDTFVIRNCYVERVGSSSIRIIGIGSSNMYLSMYDSEVYIENFHYNGKAVSAIHYIQQGTINNCVITGKGSNTSIVFRTRLGGSGVVNITRTRIRFIKSKSDSGNCTLHVNQANTVNLYDCELLSNDSYTIKQATGLINLKNTYVQTGISGSVLYIKTSGSGILNVPAGMIAATDVQAAINELDVEKVGILANTAATYTRKVKIPATAARVGNTAPTEVTIVNTRGLGFDADAELAFIAVPIPLDWNGISDIILKTAFCGTAGDAIADGETVKFDISYNSVAENEAVDNGTEATATITYTQSGAGTDKQMIIVNITIPYNDANQPITAGDALFIKFNRDVTTDTYSGMAIVQAWALQYTSNCVPK